MALIARDGFAFISENSDGSGFIPFAYEKFPRPKKSGNKTHWWRLYSWKSQLADTMAVLLDVSAPDDCDSAAKIVTFRPLPEPNLEPGQELAAFEALMLPHLDAAKNLARWLLRNDRDAEDVVQEAYLRAFKSFAGFHGSNGRAWLLTIVRNTSYTFLKKSRAADCNTTFDEQIHASDYESPSPATILEHSENAELVRQAMDELPAEFREILILRHLEGCSYKEIAEIAQLAPGTVMSRLARARVKLRECLAARIGKET